MPHQPIESPYPMPPAPNSHTVGMQHPMRMPHNTNSTTLPGSSAAGHFASPAGLGAPPSYYGGYPDAMGGPNAGAASIQGMPGGAMRGMGAGMTPAGQPSSIINLANSSDVVIGPMTQYQGSVTIYQYMDATFDASPPQLNGGARRGPVRSEATNKVSGNSSGLPQAGGEGNKKCNIFAGGTAHLWAFVILFVCVAGIAIGVFMALQYFQLQPVGGGADKDSFRTRDIRFSRQYEDETIPTLSNGHLIIDRHQWGAGPSKLANGGKRLQAPIPHVIITHVGVQSRPCDTVFNCSIKMRTIQDSAVAEKGLDDVNANFYVSDDGYVYVGRGWEIQNVYTNRSVAVCFMGDYVRYEPSSRQLEGVQYLLEFGITQKFLRPDYLLLAHNQTTKTSSPGVNVYREIVKWPHWYSGCGVDELAKCEL